MPKFKLDTTEEKVEEVEEVSEDAPVEETQGKLTVRVCGECDGEKSANGKTPCVVCNGTGELE